MDFQLKEYWVYTDNIPKILKARGINFIGWSKRSLALNFAKEEAKKLRKKILVKIAECPPPLDEFDFDNWKRCTTKDYALVYPNGKIEILKEEKKVKKRKRKK
ncbi:MAG TPA: hypothetical protein ENF38_01475 [Candidatus Aenigmarchaeota archaeon]|nr:hypothetical protein [Candidatus Aenigmarchaeota archaeon]